jgi:hypothetical protein
VDWSENISFAGTTHRVGNQHRRQQVEVRVVGETGGICQATRLLRGDTRSLKAHGAFANSGGKPNRINAAD